jgi:hypothetical protein
MGAYMFEIKVTCDESGCDRRAVVQVNNRYNESRGRFCRRHGNLRLWELQRGDGTYVAERKKR